eukprot:SAG31_NODE_9_length_42330_cov_441.979162_5_plen_136_part_00
MFATAAASVKVTYSRKHKRRQHCGHSASEMSSETTVSKRRPLDDGHWSVCEVNAQPDEIPTLNAEATQISNGYGSTASPSSNMKAQIFVGQRVAVYWKGNKVRVFPPLCNSQVRSLSTVVACSAMVRGNSDRSAG